MPHTGPRVVPHNPPTCQIPPGPRPGGIPPPGRRGRGGHAPCNDPGAGPAPRAARPPAPSGRGAPPAVPVSRRLRLPVSAPAVVVLGRCLRAPSVFRPALRGRAGGVRPVLSAVSAVAAVALFAAGAASGPVSAVRFGPAAARRLARGWSPFFVCLPLGPCGSRFCAGCSGR